MKRVLIIIMTIVMAFGLVACKSNVQEENPPQPAAPESSSSEDKKEVTETVSPETGSAETENVLVVYFSMPETTNADDMTEDEDNSVVLVDGEVLGNTQYIAYVIQEQTGADLFRIEPENPYPTDHETLVNQATEEQEENARPAMLHEVEHMEQYDTIYLGYPNWWGDMPMILFTFLEQYDLSGKTIIPFNTHGGSGFSNTIQTIEELEPNATVSKEGLSISRNKIQDAEAEIISWIDTIK